MTTPTAISPGATPWDAESWPWTETVWLEAGIEDIGNGHWRGKGAPRPGGHTAATGHTTGLARVSPLAARSHRTKRPIAASPGERYSSRCSAPPAKRENQHDVL